MSYFFGFSAAFCARFVSGRLLARVRFCRRGRRHRLALDMDIALRERNLDAGLAERFVDGETQFARNPQPAVDVRDEGAQFEQERAVAEVHEQDERFRVL